MGGVVPKLIKIINEIVYVLKVIYDGYCYIVYGSKRTCSKPCSRGLSSITCPEGKLAICECTNNGDHLTKCIRVPNSGRRLLSNDADAPYTVECIKNDKCGQMLSGYSFGIQTTQDRCNQFQCNAAELQLFEQSIDELSADLTCPACVDDYEYFDDGRSKTWDQAQAFCESIDSDLATILTEEELECACGNVVGSSPWIGMHGNHERKPYHMEYIDGAICPVQPICVGGSFWLHGKPIKCGVGSQCVRLLPDFCQIDNDITCDKQLTAILCNRAGSRSSRRLAQVGSELSISYPNEYDILNYGINASNVTIIAFVAILLCILISYVFGFYYCICKKKRNDTGTTKYEEVEVVENKL